MNILIMMAGKNNEFEKDSNMPKFLYEINGIPIIEHVVNQFKDFDKKENNFIFLIREEDDSKFHMKNTIKLLMPEATIIKVLSETSGAALTSLLAIDFLDEKKPLLIINGDQLIDINIAHIISDLNEKNLDAGTVIFNSVHPRWSYIKTNSYGEIIETAEKNPISNMATAGFYFYRRAKDYLESVKQIIIKDAHVNNIFYVCTVFNEMILKNKKVGFYKINASDYHSFMTYSLYESYKNESI